MSNEWNVPDGLNPLGKTVAETIRKFFVDQQIDRHDGGGSFYSPQEWADRDEEYGLGSLLVITHDGGSHAVAFDPEYHGSGVQESFRKELSAIGVYVENCTSWYSAVYKA
ncbi:hypothetical protein [Rhodococcus sp. (in: high G+C Gram-positive bacteria)]|uniref:hypothetical protein n=1 Tax=Rhodococcus sp. TaxID=1831 RepID=UPI003BB588C9